jgi:hypothetical protein
MDATRGHDSSEDGRKQETQNARQLAEDGGTTGQAAAQMRARKPRVQGAGAIARRHERTARVRVVDGHALPGHGEGLAVTRPSSAQAAPLAAHAAARAPLLSHAWSHARTQLRTSMTAQLAQPRAGVGGALGTGGRARGARACAAAHLHFELGRDGGHACGGGGKRQHGASAAQQRARREREHGAVGICHWVGPDCLLHAHALCLQSCHWLFAASSAWVPLRRRRCRPSRALVRCVW